MFIIVTGLAPPTIERKVFPRLESDHLIVLDLKLNAALLSAETAVRFDDLVRFDAGFQPQPSVESQVWAKAFSDVIQYGSHNSVKITVIACRIARKSYAYPRNVAPVNYVFDGKDIYIHCLG